MAYIKTATNKEGHTYVYLVEGYWKDGKVKQRIIHKYVLLDEMEAKKPGILERLKKEVKAGLLSSNQTVQVTYDLLELNLWLKHRIEITRFSKNFKSWQ